LGDAFANSTSHRVEDPQRKSNCSGQENAFSLVNKVVNEKSLLEANRVEGGGKETKVSNP
jgi:alpha-acetolactate decarboxylase